MNIIVIGGAGFTGSAVVRRLLAETDWNVLDVDRPRCEERVAEPSGHRRHRRERAELGDESAMEWLFADFRPDVVMNLTTEERRRHDVGCTDDASRADLLDTYRLLTVAFYYWERLPPEQRARFRFQQLVVDEAHDGSTPWESTRHLVTAWQRTYGFPTILTSCANTYGPFQSPEALIPSVVAKVLAGHPVTLDGDVRREGDWLHVEDHADALIRCVKMAAPGSSHDIRGGVALSDAALLRKTRGVLRALRPDRGLPPLPEDPVPDDTPAANVSGTWNKLGWHPRIAFDVGLRETVRWYLEHSGTLTAGRRAWTAPASGPALSAAT